MIYLPLSLLKSGRGTSMSGASPPLFLSGCKDNDLTPTFFCVSKEKRNSRMTKSEVKTAIPFFCSLSAQNTIQWAYILLVFCLKSITSTLDVLWFFMSQKQHAETMCPDVEFKWLYITCWASFCTNWQPLARRCFGSVFKPEFREPKHSAVLFASKNKSPRLDVWFATQNSYISSFALRCSKVSWGLSWVCCLSVSLYVSI